MNFHKLLINLIHGKILGNIADKLYLCKIAKQNHVSLKELVNNYVASLAAKVQSRNKNAVDVSFTQTDAFKSV